MGFVGVSCCLSNTEPDRLKRKQFSLSPNLKLMYLSISSFFSWTCLELHKYKSVYWSSAPSFCPPRYIICTSPVSLRDDANRQSLGASDPSRALPFGIIRQELPLWVSHAEDGSLKELTDLFIALEMKLNYLTKPRKGQLSLRGVAPHCLTCS